MCSERDLGAAFREGPVDRQEICYCSVPEAVQVVLRKVQILSFADPRGVGPAAEVDTPSDQEPVAA